MAERECGKVKWFNEAKGYGFIVRDNGDDLFVHRNDLPAGLDRLNEETRVSFDLVETRKGQRATNVALA